MNELSVIIKALLEKQSKDNILNEIKQIQDTINKSPLKFKIETNSDEFKKLSSELEKLSLNLNKISSNTPGIGAFDSTKLNKSYETIRNITNEFKKQGEVKTTAILDPNDLQTIKYFNLELTKADNTVEQMGFKLKDILDANGKSTGETEYVVDNYKIVDNTQALREKTLRQEQETRSKIEKQNLKEINDIQNKVYSDALSSLRNQFNYKTQLLTADEKESQVLKEKLKYEEDRTKYLLKQLDLENSVQLGKEERNLQNKFDIKTSSTTFSGRYLMPIHGIYALYS
jgi:hypothetical protein